MLYFDTSFLAPLLLPESTSDKIAEFVRGLSIEEQAVSYWTWIEFSSLVARKVRMGELQAEGAGRANARFDARVADIFTVLLPSADDFSLAKRYLAQIETGLRTGDALHLAIASNRHAAAIFSLDGGFLKAGRILDLPVRAGIHVE